MGKRFDEFLKRLDVVRPQLPKDLSDGLDIILTGIFEMIRGGSRNHFAGHPPGACPRASRSTRATSCSFRTSREPMRS